MSGNEWVALIADACAAFAFGVVTGWRLHARRAAKPPEPPRRPVRDHPQA